MYRKRGWMSMKEDKREEGWVNSAPETVEWACDFLLLLFFICGVKWWTYAKEGERTSKKKKKEGERRRRQRKSQTSCLPVSHTMNNWSAHPGKGEKTLAQTLGFFFFAFLPLLSNSCSLSLSLSLSLTHSVRLSFTRQKWKEKALAKALAAREQGEREGKKRTHSSNKRHPFPFVLFAFPDWQELELELDKRLSRDTGRQSKTRRLLFILPLFLYPFQTDIDTAHSLHTFSHICFQSKQLACLQVVPGHSLESSLTLALTIFSFFYLLCILFLFLFPLLSLRQLNT